MAFTALGWLIVAVLFASLLLSSPFLFRRSPTVIYVASVEESRGVGCFSLLLILGLVFALLQLLPG